VSHGWRSPFGTAPPLREGKGFRLAIVPLLFLGAFFVYPIAAILTTSLGGARTTTGPLLDAGVVWFTIWQAVLSTALTLVAGLPIAYVTARYEFPGRRFLRAATVVPFVLPTLVVGVAFLALVGPTGILGVDLTGTAAAIVASHVFFNVAVVVRIVGGLWEHLDPRLEDAARSLGATPGQVLRRVTLPLLRPAVASAAAIVFLFSFTAFGTVLVLGGPGIATIEVEIYRRTAFLFDLRGAAILAILQMVGVTAALFLYARHQDRSRIAQTLTAARPRRPHTRRQRMVVALTVLWTLCLVGLPTLVLAWRALTRDGRPTLAGFRALQTSPFVDVAASATTSLGYAAIAMVIAIGVGLPAALVIAAQRGRLSRWFDTLLMLPLGTSAVTLGFGMLLALDAPIDLRASAALVPIAHALVAIPFVVRSLVPVLGSIRRRLREAAATLGASPGRIHREIDLPIAGRAAAVGAGFAFVISLGEFGATSLLARPGAPTLPLAVFRLLGRPGALNVQGAMLLCLGLMVLTVVIVLAIDRLRLPGEGWF
jgi:thiamine transport system permease protein